MLTKISFFNYENIEPGPIDTQGWRTDQPVLYDALKKGGVFAEIGVWKGYTAIEMAKRSGGQVLAVDHWRGSSEHILNPKWRKDLPGLYDQFRRNVVAEGLQDKIVPLALESQAAFEVCAHAGVRFDLVHIDAAHDESSVLCDLMRWSRLTHCIVLDDYHRNWPGVISAAEFFLKECGWTKEREEKGKALLRYIE